MIVVVGVGNVFRSDDGAGLAVAERVRERAPEGVVVRVCEAEPTRLIETWAGAELAVVADAVSSGAPTGTVHRFDATDETIPARIFGSSSTHATPRSIGTPTAMAWSRSTMGPTRSRSC